MNLWLNWLNEHSMALVMDFAWPLLWQSSLLILVVAISLHTVFRRASSQLRYALWAIVLIRLVLPPTLDLPTSIRHWGTPHAEAYIASLWTEEQSQITIPQEISLSTPPPSTSSFVPPPHREGGAALVTPPQTVTQHTLSLNWASCLVLCWMSGILLFSVVLILRLFRIKRMLLFSTTPPAWLAALTDEYNRTLSTRISVGIRIVQEDFPPALLGFIRPVIVIPETAIRTLNEEELRAVVVHEMAHVKRFDFLVNWLQVLLGIVYFWHPVLWYANRQMRVEREHACDDVTLIALGLNRKGYAESLLRVAEHLHGGWRLTPVQVGIGETRLRLARRMRRILNTRIRPLPRMSVLAVLAVVLFASVFSTWQTVDIVSGQTNEERSSEQVVEDGVRVRQLQIKVVNEENEPIEGAEITPTGLRSAVNPASHYGWSPTSTHGVSPNPLTTDANGVVTLQYPCYVNDESATAQVILRIHHPHYTIVPIKEIPAGSEVQHIVLKRSGMVRLSGYITNEDEPVSPVYAITSYDTHDAFTETEPGVLESNNLPAGTHHLWLAYQAEDGTGYFSEAIRLDMEEDTNISLNAPLSRGVQLNGKLDESVPRPVIDGWAEVNICPEYYMQGDRSRKQEGIPVWCVGTEVNEDGTFSLKNLPRGHAEIAAGCSDAASNSISELKHQIGKPTFINLDATENEVVVAMQATSTFVIKARDLEGNELEGVEVSFSPNIQFFDWISGVIRTPVLTDPWDMYRLPWEELQARYANRPYPYTVTIDETGTVIIQNLPAWSTYLSASHEGLELQSDDEFGANMKAVSVQLTPGETSVVGITLAPKGTETIPTAPPKEFLAALHADPTDPFALATTPARILKGQVVDEDGNPIKGVLVDIWTWYSGNEIETDSSGAFSLEGFSPDQKTVEVRFSKDGYSPVYMYRQPLGELIDPVVMTTKTYFEGSVIDEAGNPVANALIRADAGEREAEGVLLSDTTTAIRTKEDGSFHFPVQHDTYTITVVANNEAATLKDVNIAKHEAKHLDIQLRGTPIFRAKIVNSQTNEPVQGVRLYNSRANEVDTYSDAEGNILIKGIPEGEFELYIDAKELGYVRWWSEDAVNEWDRYKVGSNGWQRNFDDITFNIAYDMDPVLIMVEPGARIRGKVRDPEGNPVAWATVAPALTGTSNSITGDTRFSVQTNEDGTFDTLLPASNATEYNLIAHDGDYGEWRTWANGKMSPVKTKPGEVIENVEIRLQNPYTVRGKVVDESGQPVVERRVRAMAVERDDNRYYVPECRTDENGEFELKFIAPGEHYLQLAPYWLNPIDAPAGTSKTVVVTEASNIADVLLVAKPENTANIVLR